MLYLVLKRDLERISLARKYVLSDRELPDAMETILYIIKTAWSRVRVLESESEERVAPLQSRLIFVGIFEQRGHNAKDQFEVFAMGLVSVFTLTTRKYRLHGLPAVQNL